MSYFDYDSPVPIRDQHLQKRAAREASGQPRLDLLTPLLKNLDPSVTHSRHEISDRQSRGALLSQRQNELLAFSAAFRNTVMPYKITPVESYDEAKARLKEIFGQNLFLQESSNMRGDTVLYINSPKPVKIAPITGDLTHDSKEAVIAYTNDILQTISRQVRGQSNKISIEASNSPAFKTYKEMKTTELEKVVSDINRYKLVGESKIEQDPINPLLIAFLGTKDSDPIEVVNFSNLDLAIAALKGFKKDFASLKALDLNPTPDKELKAQEILSRFRQSYTSNMINFMTNNLTNLNLAA